MESLIFVDERDSAKRRNIELEQSRKLDSYNNTKERKSGRFVTGIQFIRSSEMAK